MDPKSTAFRLLARRRTSYPTAAIELTTLQKRQGEKEKVTRTAKSAFELHSSSRTSELLQRSKMPRVCLSDGGDILVCLRKLKHIHVLKSVDSNSPSYASKSTTSSFEEPFNGCGLEDGLNLHREKNEAEIIGDFPVNQRRMSLPAVSNSGGFMPGLVVSSAAFITVHNQGQAKRRFGSLASSVDRELLCLRKNNKEEERLQQTFRRIDKQSLADNVVFRRRIQKIFNEYNKLVQVSPTVDEWLATRPHISAHGRRERTRGTYNRCLNQ